MSIEALRFKSLNATGRRTWIYISNSGTVKSTEVVAEIASFSTITK